MKKLPKVYTIEAAAGFDQGWNVYSPRYGERFVGGDGEFQTLKEALYAAWNDSGFGPVTIRFVEDE